MTDFRKFYIRRLLLLKIIDYNKKTVNFVNLVTEKYADGGHILPPFNLKGTNLNYTLEDYKEKRCTLDQVGCEIPEPVVRPQGGTPKETVNLFMDAFHELGGLDELVKFGRANPGKFYDQLLRLLISMDAPKQSAQSTKDLETLPDQELLSMSSQDLKRLLTKSLPD